MAEVNSSKSYGKQGLLSEGRAWPAKVCAHRRERISRRRVGSESGKPTTDSSFRVPDFQRSRHFTVVRVPHHPCRPFLKVSEETTILYSFSSQFATNFNFEVSQGSAATNLTCDGQYYMRFVGNLVGFLTVKEL